MTYVYAPLDLFKVYHSINQSIWIKWRFRFIIFSFPLDLRPPRTASGFGPSRVGERGAKTQCVLYSDPGQRVLCGFLSRFF